MINPCYEQSCCLTVTTKYTIVNFEIVVYVSIDCRFYMRRDGRPTVDNNDPQKLLNIQPFTTAGSERPKIPDGSLGYAVNLIHLNEDQLSIRISGRYGLRESLFFELFGFLEVFDTTPNMLRSRKDIRSSAVSLEGGLIRTSNQFETYSMYVCNFLCASVLSALQVFDVCSIVTIDRSNSGNHTLDDVEEVYYPKLGASYFGVLMP